MAEEKKGASMSLRLAKALKHELDNAAWLERRDATDIVLEGIEMALQPIRAKHGGRIPEPEEVLAKIGQVAVPSKKDRKSHAPK